jgi:arylsulfatase A-like enzyme
MDNLGYGEVGCYGGGVTRGAATPRIDKLATEGTRLTNFNVEAQCTPSRSALMTGALCDPLWYALSADRRRARGTNAMGK